MTRIRSFAPVAEGNAARLILGSIPGVASLRAHQYYAHPRNQFWPIIGELFGMDSGMPYAGKVGVLSSSGIALWDVLKSCNRAGSLDAYIKQDSIVPNDFSTFFARHPQVREVYFNGATAEQLFRRHVLPGLPAGLRTYERLPSTSPAHAAMPYADKLASWRVITIGVGLTPRPPSRRRRR